MKKGTGLFILLLLCSVPACAQDMRSGNHHGNGNAPAAAEPAETQEWAKQKLAKSPRHREWVKVKNGNREVSSFVVYPEVKNKATAVVVIHEIFGGTSSLGGGSAVGQAIRDLPPDQITGDLNAAADYVAKLPAANGKIVCEK
ncbi:MAG TPA: hypothetical protein VFZ22_09425 [Pyrinomonadaceae bacterium]|nr:hypothetical protein [Pyrinomonadaceae bacterium]